MKIQIKNRYTEAVLFEGDYVSLAVALVEAVKNKTDLCGANLRDANLSGAYLGGAYLGGIVIPKIPNIDAAILASVEGDKACGLLDMATWHQCETTHCRAGWAIHLAGKPGYALEKKFGPCVAGALIYMQSRPDKPVPDFHASNADAMADIKRCAEEEKALS
jgi:uncharacterized protein YjbI with pentapeptide repeats